MSPKPPTRIGMNSLYFRCGMENPGKYFCSRERPLQRERKKTMKKYIKQERKQARKRERAEKERGIYIYSWMGERRPTFLPDNYHSGYTKAPRHWPGWPGWILSIETGILTHLRVSIDVGPQSR